MGLEKEKILIEEKVKGGSKNKGNKVEKLIVG